MQGRMVDYIRQVFASLSDIPRHWTLTSGLGFEYKICVDAGKAGVGKDAASATRMSLDEAQKVLGISKDAPLEEVLKVIFSDHLHQLRSSIHITSVLSCSWYGNCKPRDLSESKHLIILSKKGSILCGLKWNFCVQRYQHLFDINGKHSFYIQSKVHRARERIEEELKEEASKDLWLLRLLLPTVWDTIGITRVTVLTSRPSE